MPGTGRRATGDVARARSDVRQAYACPRALLVELVGYVTADGLGRRWLELISFSLAVGGLTSAVRPRIDPETSERMGGCGAQQQGYVEVEAGGDHMESGAPGPGRRSLEVSDPEY